MTPVRARDFLSEYSILKLNLFIQFFFASHYINIKYAIYEGVNPAPVLMTSLIKTTSYLNSEDLNFIKDYSQNWGAARFDYLQQNMYDEVELRCDFI